MRSNICATPASTDVDVPSSHVACSNSMSSPQFSYCFMSGSPAPSRVCRLPSAGQAQQRLFSPASRIFSTCFMGRKPTQSKGADQIDDIAIAIPCQVAPSRRVIPAEIDAADLRPVTRNREWIDHDLLEINGKHAALAHGRDTEDARVTFMLRILVGDRSPGGGRVELGISQRP